MDFFHKEDKFSLDANIKRVSKALEMIVELFFGISNLNSTHGVTTKMKLVEYLKDQRDLKKN